MSHMVIYRTADGQPGYHQADALEEAVSFVERLRNSDGVDHARIFRMEEVTFDFRPYFRVEVGSDSHAVAAAPAAPAQPAPEPRMATPFAPAAPAAPVAPVPSASVDERNWMDLPIVDEPAEAPVPSPEPRVGDLSPFGEPAPAAEQGAPMFEAVPPPPPPPPPAPPSVDEDAVGTSNGLGARRGLFGR